MVSALDVESHARFAGISTAITYPWPESFTDDGDAHESPVSGPVEAFLHAGRRRDLSTYRKLGIGFLME